MKVLRKACLDLVTVELKVPQKRMVQHNDPIPRVSRIFHESRETDA